MPVSRSPARPPSGSPAYSPTDLPAYRGGSSFSPLDLSPVSWLISGISTLYQDSAGATPVTAAGQDVGKRDDQSGNARNMTQATATARPTYETGPARLEYDVDDALSCTLPAISGGQIVIISPAGTWIDDVNFAGGTFTVGPDTYTGGPAGLMTLLGNEEMEIVILPTAMTEVEQAKMVAYAKSIGSAGLITHPTEKLGGGDFEAGLIGAKSDGSGSVSTWSINTTAPISGTQDGRLVITTPASLRPLINFSSGIMSGFETGKSYVLEFDYKLNSGSFLFRYTIGGPVASVFGTVSGASGKVRLIHEATATNTQLFFYFDSSTCDAQLDNISVREVIMP